MVRVGISLSSSITAESPSRAAAMMVERAAAAYDAGMTSLSVGESADLELPCHDFNFGLPFFPERQANQIAECNKMPR